MKTKVITVRAGAPPTTRPDNNNYEHGKGGCGGGGAPRRGSCRDAVLRQASLRQAALQAPPSAWDTQVQLQPQ